MDYKRTKTWKCVVVDVAQREVLVLKAYTRQGLVSELNSYRLDPGDRVIFYHNGNQA